MKKFLPDHFQLREVVFRSTSWQSLIHCKCCSPQHGISSLEADLFREVYFLGRKTNSSSDCDSYSKARRFDLPKLSTCIYFYFLLCCCFPDKLVAFILTQISALETKVLVSLFRLSDRVQVYKVRHLLCLLLRNECIRQLLYITR